MGRRNGIGRRRLELWQHPQIRIALHRRTFMPRGRLRRRARWRAILIEPVLPLLHLHVETRR